MKPRIKSMICNKGKKKTTNQNNKKKKESKTNKDSINSFWDNFKHSNICLIGVPQKEKRKNKKLEI